MAWLKYLMIFGGVQGVILSLAILSIDAPKKKLIYRLFAFLALCMAIYLFANSNRTFLYSYPRIYLLSFSFIFCYTSVFHLFLLASTRESFKLKPVHLLYAVPIIAYLIALFPWLLSTNQEIFNNIYIGPTHPLNWADRIGVTFNLFFTIQSAVVIQKNRKLWTNKQFAFISLFWSVVCISNVFWLILLLPKFGLLQIPGIFHMIMWIVTAMLIFFFTYFVIIKSEFFAIGPSKDTYKRIALTPEELRAMSNQIKQAMELNKPYLKPDFTLGELAEILGFDKFKLSVVINKGMKTSFFELVNSYRLNEFVELMESGQFKNYNTMGIAMEAGFKSKSTFYKAFKELKGCSPQQFLSELEASQ